MGQSNSPPEGGAPRPLSYTQCPWCGFNNGYVYEAGPPGTCEKCEVEFPDPMEARAAFMAMRGRGFWFNFRRLAEGYFAGQRVRLVLLGVALGTARGEIGRRLWLS